MLRTDVSFRLCLRETIAWTASTEQGSIFHTACITSFSNSASGGRMTARVLVGFVMVQLVPHTESVDKRFLHGLLAVREDRIPSGDRRPASVRSADRHPSE